jgi:hypothetical protein
MEEIGIREEPPTYCNSQTNFAEFVSEHWSVSVFVLLQASSSLTSVITYDYLTIKLAHDQSLVLKCEPFPVLSYKISYELNHFKEVTCLNRPCSLDAKGNLLIHV